MNPSPRWGAEAVEGGEASRKVCRAPNVIALDRTSFPASEGTAHFRWRASLPCYRLGYVVQERRECVSPVHGRLAPHRGDRPGRRGKPIC
jgi:hypothetical protein